jgi:hypothetical protein
VKPGIHRITMAEYIADPCDEPSLSSGVAFKLIHESPLHAWHAHPRLGGRPATLSNVADTGSTAHDLLLGGEGKICEIDPAAYRSKPTKDNPQGNVPVGWTNDAIRAARDLARSNGLTPMLRDDLIVVRSMVKAAREFIAASEIASVFDAGECELTAISHEGETILRTRPDWLNLQHGISLSYKTTKASAHPDAFGRIVRSMGYDFGLMFYERALRGAIGKWSGRHIILAQEQNFPYACSLFELSPDKAELERANVERAINLWRECTASGVWSGYGSQVHTIEPRPWELPEIEVEYAE